MGRCFVKEKRGFLPSEAIKGWGHGVSYQGTYKAGENLHMNSTCEYTFGFVFRECAALEK